MAPNSSGIFKGVSAIVSVFNEDGSNASAHVEALIKEHGGSIVKRISSGTHLIWSKGEPRLLAEAKEMKKKTVLPSWIEVCTGAGMVVSTQAFKVNEDQVPLILPTTTATGRRKSVVVGGGKRPLTGKRSLETLRNEADNLPSPSHELEAQAPKAREQARKKLRKSMGGGLRKSVGAGTAAAARRRASAPAKVVALQSEYEEESDEEEQEQENRPPAPARAAPASSGRKRQPPPAKQQDEEESESEEEEVEEEASASPDAAWSPVRPGGSVAPTPSGTTASAAKKRARMKIQLADEEAESEAEEVAVAAPIASARKGKGSKGKASPAPAQEGAETEGMGRGSTWNCTVCTAANRARATKCEVCEYPRGMSLKEAAAAEKKKEAAAAKRASVEGKDKPKGKGKEEESEAAAEVKPKKKKAAAAKEGEKGASKGPKGKSAAVAAKKKKKEPRSSTGSSSAMGSTSGKGSGSSGKKQTPKAKAKPKAPQQEASRASAASSTVTTTASSEAGNGNGGAQLVLGCTGLEPEVKQLVEKQVKDLVKALAGRARVKYSTSSDSAAHLTHLLVPSDGREPRRTAKILFALARGAHIVGTDWLADSLKAAQQRGQGDNNNGGDDDESTQPPGPLADESRYATERFPPRAALRNLLAEEGPVFLAPSCIDPGEKMLGALIKEVGGQVTKSLKDATLVLAPAGPATEGWMRTTLAAKAKGESLTTLLADHCCVTPQWLYDAIDASVVPEERSSYALAAPGVAAAAAGGPANEEEAAE